MRAEDVASLQVELAALGFGWCVVGGWGVDALLGTQTRTHKDLDVLLPFAAMDATLSLLAQQGFRMAYLWEETRPNPGTHQLVGSPLPSAFVLTHADGRELDIHVYDIEDDQVSILWDTHRTLRPQDLSAVGHIGGVEVRCMTASMQLKCHEGYELPASHLEDVLRLRHLIATGER